MIGLQLAADIPEVEAELENVFPVVHGHWQKTTRESLRAMEAELERIERGDPEGLTRTEVTAAIVAILLLMRRKIDEPMSDRRRSAIRASSRRLILAGASASGGFGRLRLRGPTIQRFTRRGARELEAMSKWRFRSARIQQRLDAALDDFLSNEEARRTVIERKKQEAKDEAARAKRLDRLNRVREREGRQPLKVSPEKPKKPSDRRDGLPGAADRKAWFEGVEALMRQAGRISDQVADAWAYRQYNIGRYIAMRARGVRTIVAFNNPPGGPDDRTTKFCRWVHRRPISIKRVEASLDGLAEALRDDDVEKLKSAAPLLALRKGQTGADFRRMFLTVGLPPYHWLCRTVAREGR